MKTILSLVAAAAVLTAIGSTTALASEGTRGGGKGVVCRDTHRTIKSVELLDLWEAKALYQRTIKLSNAPLRVQVANAIKNIGTAMNWTVDQYNPGRFGSYADMVQNNISGETKRFTGEAPADLRTNMHWLKGVSLTLTDDSYEIAKPENCEIEQIVDYNDASDQVYINTDLFDKMNITNQAALIVHESIYAELRRNSTETNSLRTRRAVGYIFSGHPLPGSTVPSKYIGCYGENALADVAAIYPNPDGKTYSSVVLKSSDHQVLGFFPTAAKVTTMTDVTADDIPMYLTDEVCTKMAPNDTYMFWLNFSSKSPINDDTNESISISCNNGHVDLRWLPARSESGGPVDIRTAEKVTCKWVDSTKAH